MTRPVADKSTTAAAEAAERAQAEYYRCVLAERRAEIDLAILKLLISTSALRASGSSSTSALRASGSSSTSALRASGSSSIPRHDAHSAVSDLGGVVREAERERQDIDRMIDALDRRFPRADLTSLRPPPPPDEVIHPDGRSLLSIGQNRRSAKNPGRVDQEKVS